MRGDETRRPARGLPVGPGSQLGATITATTVVSSGLLRRLAHAAGAGYAETLTGFKWIMHDSAARSRLRFLFGYEEAIGYAVNDIVRDKDGISAALVVAGIAAEAKQQGRTLADRLDDIARRFGLYATEEFSLELPGAAGSAHIRSSWPHCGGAAGRDARDAVTEIDDGATGTRRARRRS